MIMMAHVEILSPDFWQIINFETLEQAEAFVAKFNSMVADLSVENARLVPFCG